MLEVKYRKTAELIPYARNSRTHSTEQVQQIAGSIKEFGFTNPILIDEEGGIIAGHGRVMASQRMGLEEVPTITLYGLTEAQKKAYVIADNKLALNAGWDEEMLKIEIEELYQEGYDIDLLGFTDDELMDLDIDFDGEDLPELDETKADEVPEVEETPVIKRGDIIELGNHRLMCGDSTSEDDVKKLMDGQTFKLLFTDPPYELQTQGGGILKSANSMKQIDKNEVGSFNPLTLKLYADTNIFCHNKPLIKKYIELAEQNNKPFDLCFYKKNNVAPNYGGHLMTDTEYIAVIGAQSPNKGHEKETYSKAFIGDKDKDNTLSYSKPVALCEKYLKLYADKKVLDLFGGSGSTLIAAENLNIKCFIMEKLGQYAQVIVQRWCDYTSIRRIKINGIEVDWEDYKEKNKR